MLASAHANPTEGLRLNRTMDTRLLVAVFAGKSPLKYTFGEELWLATGPSMQIYYDNMKRIQSGDFWLWAKPDTIDDYNHKLQELDLVEKRENEDDAMMTILCCLSCTYRRHGTGEIAQSAEDAPYSAVSQKISQDFLSSAKLPLGRFLEVYLDDGRNTVLHTDWQVKQNALLSFRKWAHK
jgi:hypothetical protein